MTAAALLAVAEAEGVSLRLAAPDRLTLRGDPGALARWAPRLRPRKTALLDLLTQRAADVAEAVADLAGAFYQHHWGCTACRRGTQVGVKLHRPLPGGRPAVGCLLRGR